MNNHRRHRDGLCAALDIPSGCHDPITLALTALAVGGSVSAGASVKQGMDAKKQSKREALGILTRARQESAIVGENAAREASAKRAAAGASGLAGEGSVLSQLGTLFDASLQQRNINTSAAINAQSVLKQGKNAQTAGILGAVSTVLGTAGQVGILGADAGAFGKKSTGSTTGMFGKPTPTLGFSQGF